MILRPVDENGDVLPVLVSSALLKGVPAEKTLVSDRLALLTGEWWENRSWGNAIVEMLKENRFTESDQLTLANYLTSYIRATDGVRDVRDVSFAMDGKQFCYSCTIITAEGSALFNYEL